MESGTEPTRYRRSQHQSGTGQVLVSSNLPAWDHYPLRETLAGRLRLPVALDNDANMAALGEHRYGAGGVSHLCYVTLSTGMVSAS